MNGRWLHFDDLAGGVVPEVDYSRVIVVGPRAAGKSTVSERLAERLSLDHVELDAIRHRWGLGDADAERFRTLLAPRVAGERWLADGNYLEGIAKSVRDVVWPRATTVIWLDLPFLLTVRRLMVRTHRRVVLKQPIRQDHVDRKRLLMKRLASANAVRGFWLGRRTYPALFEQPEHGHLTIIRLRTPQEVELWLATIA